MGWVIILPKTVGVASLRKGRVSRDLEELGELIMLISKGNVFQAEGTASAKALGQEHTRPVQRTGLLKASVAEAKQGWKEVRTGPARLCRPG